MSCGHAGEGIRHLFFAHAFVSVCSLVRNHTWQHAMHAMRTSKPREPRPASLVLDTSQSPGINGAAMPLTEEAYVQLQLLLTAMATRDPGGKVA